MKATAPSSDGCTCSGPATLTRQTALLALTWNKLSGRKWEWKAQKPPFLGSGVPVLGNKSKEANFLWIAWTWTKMVHLPDKAVDFVTAGKKDDLWTCTGLYENVTFSYLTAVCRFVPQSRQKTPTERYITEWEKALEHRKITKTSADPACLWVECHMMSIQLPVVSSQDSLVLLHTWIKTHLPALLPLRRSCLLSCEISSACLSGLLCCNLGG